MNEASYIIKKNEDDYIDRWNQTRFISYCILQSQSTKKIKPTDVIEFPWEKNEPEEILPKRSKEELYKYSLEMEKIINKANE